MKAVLTLVVFTLAIPTAARAEEVPKQMIKRVAKTVGCEPAGVTATFVGKEPIPTTKAVRTSWTIDGCDDQFIVTYWVYAGWAMSDDRKLRSKAPFDLNCDKDKLRYTFIDWLNRGVEGCGTRVTYINTSSGWIANVQSQ